MKKAILLGCLMGLGAILSAQTILDGIRSEKERFRVVQLAGGLSHPWALAFLPDGSLLVSERRGRLLIWTQGRVTPVEGLPSLWVSGQGGLWDLALDPAFEENHLLFFSFAKPGEGGAGTALASGRLLGQRLDQVQILWEMKKKTSSTLQFGGRIALGPEGILYFTTGDRGEMNRAQDGSDSAGKILRLLPDGRVPRDNPFRDRPGFLPEIFALGVRNPEGLALRPGTGEIWFHSHGPKGGDVVNFLIPGANYGWPVITYGVNYNGTPVTPWTSRPGMTQPVAYYVPSIAPSGLTFYRGKAFPGWEGNLFLGALAGQQLRRLTLQGDRVVSQEILLKNLVGRIRDVRTGPDGFLYLLTDQDPGQILRLEPAFGP